MGLKSWLDLDLQHGWTVRVRDVRNDIDYMYPLRYLVKGSLKVVNKAD